jgi:hypothetical protein
MHAGMIEPVSDATREIGKFAKRDPPAFVVFNGQVIGLALGGTMQELMDEHHLVLQLGMDQLFHVGNGVEVINRGLVRFDLDVKPLLEKQDQADRGQGVEDSPGNEGSGGGQLGRVLATKELLENEGLDGIADLLLGQSFLV